MNQKLLNTFSKKTKQVFLEEGEVFCQAPSNIALVKYWGKKPQQIPMNASLSFTLKKSVTKTKLKWKRKTEKNDTVSFEYYFENKRDEAFENKVSKFLNSQKEVLKFLSDYDLCIESENTFPHSAGIASSASSMAALATCLKVMESLLDNQNLNLNEVSSLSRLGSGSACRSIDGGFNHWGINSLEYATHLEGVHDNFKNLCDSILIIDSKPKNVSSTAGHKLMDEHLYREVRIKQANKHVNELVEVLKEGNWKRFCEITELEAMTLHSLMMSSTPSFQLMKPNTLKALDKIKEFQKNNDYIVTYTLDAGPNIHLIYDQKNSEKVQDFIKTDLTEFLEEGRWIDDEMGEGTELL